MTAFRALLIRELTRMLRQRVRLAVTLATPVVVWLFLASGFAESVRPAIENGAGTGPELGPNSGSGYAAYLLPGVVSLLVLFASIFGAISLIEDRASGFLQSALVSPAPAWSVGLSKVLGGAIVASVQAGLLFVVAPVLGVQGSLAGVAGAFAAVVLLAIGTTGFSLMLAWRIGSVAGFHGAMNLVLMPAWMLSGAVFPIAGAAGWLRVVAAADPIAWPTELMRAMLGVSWSGEPIMPVAMLWGLSVIYASAGLAAAVATISSRGGSGRP